VAYWHIVILAHEILRGGVACMIDGGEGKAKTIWIEPVRGKRRSSLDNLQPFSGKPRKERKDKRERITVTIDEELHDKLKRLAFACDMSKTALSAEILRIVLNNENWINFLQDKFQADQKYRITPVRQGGKLIY
jgi:hypothetical protein